MSTTETECSPESLHQRLAFVGIDADTRATLRAMRPTIAAILPGVLDAFYAHISRYPDAGGLFADPAHMRHAKEMQIRHWDVIAQAGFDDDYVRSVTRIGEAHHRLGLEPRWYIGGYSFLLKGLLTALECDVSLGRFGAAVRARKAKLMAAITAAALLDMDFAICVYLDAGKRERHLTLDRLATAFSDSVGAITETVSSTAGRLEAAATTLTRTAEGTQDLAKLVASASEEASTNVQSVATATEELGASISEISRQVQESSRIAGEAVRQAEKTDARITELSHAASRIGDVVKLITAIADQTNLLALNATIEAARAGEAGKGFAVVASEVKSLANQTAKATDEIAGQIAAMQAATQDSVGAIKEIGQTIVSISHIASAIAAAVEEQGAATGEIARNVQNAAHGTTQVAANIGKVDRGASDTGVASSQVLSAAQALSHEGGQLKNEVAKFLATVRAA